MLFDSQKSTAEAHQTLLRDYDDTAPLYPRFRFWFQRFKGGDFDVNDKKRFRQSKKFQENDLQDLLYENPAQTLKEI